MDKVSCSGDIISKRSARLTLNTGVTNSILKFINKQIQSDRIDDECSCVVSDSGSWKMIIFYTNGKRQINDEARAAALHILEANIVCGNVLSMMCVDEYQQDTDQLITFPEWTFPFNDARIKRRDFRFDVLLKENSDEENYNGQFQLFSDDAMGFENWMIDPITNELVPKPIREYPLVHYRRMCENG